MNSRARRKQLFLRANPLCCFCGGETPSEEIDHIPSRACFDNKYFPDGFEFPTCRACNASTSQDEQVVALFSRMLAHPHVPALPIEIGKYMAGVANNSAAVILEMGNAHARLGADLHVLELGDAAHGAFDRVLRRWAKAFHYRETGRIVPTEGRLYTSLFSNANADKVPPGALEGRVHVLLRNGKDIGDQFGYVTRNDPDRPDLGYYTAMFRRSFLAIMLVDFHGEIIDDAHADQPFENL